MKSDGRSTWALGVVATLAAGLVAALLVLDVSISTGAALALVVGLLVGTAAINHLGVQAPIAGVASLYAGALAVFHLGLLVPWSLGLWEAPAWLEAAAPATVSRAVLCVGLAFGSLEVGLLLGWGRYFRRCGASLQPPVVPRRLPSVFHSGGYALVALAVLAVVANLSRIGFQRFLEASYGFELYAVTDARLLQMGMYWLLPTGALVLLAGARPGVEMRRALVVGATVVLVFFWTGHRGPAVTFVAAEVVVWTYLYGPVPLRVVGSGAALLLCVLPIVGAIRMMPRNAVTMGEIQRAALEASPLGALAEMGASFRPLVETIRLVPREAPFGRGRSYVNAVRRALPNLGAEKAGIAGFDPMDLPPNHWITFTVDPYTYATYGGLGFSGVAEPYLSFGIAGIVAYFIVLGIVLGRVEVRLAAGVSRRTIVFLAVVFAPLLLTVRNDFHNFVRPALWSIGLVWLIEQLHGKPQTVPRPPALRSVAAHPRGAA